MRHMNGVSGVYQLLPIVLTLDLCLACFGLVANIPANRFFRATKASRIGTSLYGEISVSVRFHSRG